MRGIGYHGWLSPCSSVEVSEGCFHIKSIIGAAAAEGPEGPGAMMAKIEFLLEHHVIIVLTCRLPCMRLEEPFLDVTVGHSVFCRGAIHR